MGTKDSSSSSLDGSELQKVIGRAAELQRDAAERAPVGSSLDEVKEIAEQVGYADRYFFSKDFKKHAGVTPSEFRVREAARLRL